VTPIILGERIVLPVIGVGIDENVMNGDRRTGFYYKKGMPENPIFAEGQLNDISWLHISDAYLLAKRTGTFSLTGKKIIEIGYTRPGRRPVIKVIIIPTQIFCKIHNPAARINALRDKIRAISAKVCKIVIGRIPAQSPPVRIIKGLLPVVFSNRTTHKKAPFQAALLVF